MEKKLTFREAKRLSILKWEQIVKDKGKLIHENLPKEVKSLFNNCGMCELRHNQGKGCDTCELIRYYKDERCCGAAFENWLYNQNKKNAQAVLDVVKSIKKGFYLNGDKIK